MCILLITIISENEINTISKVKEGRKNYQSKKKRKKQRVIVTDIQLITWKYTEISWYWDKVSKVLENSQSLSFPF